jgi:peptide/nickel transport system substrate-binding protein
MLVGALFGKEALAQDATPGAEQTPFPATPEGSYAPGTGVEWDEFIVGVQGIPSNVDPAQNLGNVGTRVAYTPYDTLIRRDFLNDNVNVPMIATSWQHISDTVLELKLRDDVTFHDGSPMTADDVVYTFTRLITAPADSPLLDAGTRFLTFQSVEAVDPTTVRITTKAPDPVLINRLASWAGWIVSKNYIETNGQEKFEQTGMGTGPFKFTSFTPDTEITLERHDGYWGELPPVKKITFKVIPEIAARVTALINGEVHLITNVPPDQVETLAAEDHLEVRDVILSNTHVLVYNTHQAALSDKRVRQALNAGIDRQLIIDTIWDGHARAKHSEQMEEFGALYNPDRPLTPYDPDKAKALLAEAGYDGAEIPYQTGANYYTNSGAVCQAIVPMWQELGINAKAAISDETLKPEDRFVYTWSNSSIIADPDGYLTRCWGPNSSPQLQSWDAPAEFNELAVQAQSTLDVQERYAIYQRMLDIWEDEAPGTVLYDPAEFYAIDKRVNWTPYPLYSMDLRAYNLSFNEAE